MSEDTIRDLIVITINYFKIDDYELEDIDNIVKHFYCE